MSWSASVIPTPPLTLKIADTLRDDFSNTLDRVHVDGLHANSPRALDILFGVVEEENPTQWYADRCRDFREGLWLWLSDAQVRRHKDAPKVLQRLGVEILPIRSHVSGSSS